MFYQCITNYSFSKNFVLLKQILLTLVIRAQSHFWQLWFFCWFVLIRRKEAFLTENRCWFFFHVYSMCFSLCFLWFFGRRECKHRKNTQQHRITLFSCINSSITSIFAKQTKHCSRKHHWIFQTKKFGQRVEKTTTFFDNFKNMVGLSKYKLFSVVFLLILWMKCWENNHIFVFGLFCGAFCI